MADEARDLWLKWLADKASSDPAKLEEFAQLYGLTEDIRADILAALQERKTA